MRRSKLMNPFFYSVIAASTICLSGCSNDDREDTSYQGNTDRELFNIVLGVGDDGNDGVYVQALNDIASGTVSFNNYGFEIPADRTARVCSNEDGKYIYSLDYGGGTMTKFKVNGGQSYTQITKIDVKLAIGTNPRWGKVSDDMALLHNITTANKYKDEAGTLYDYTAATAQLVAINLGGEGAMTMGAIQNLEIPRSQEDIENNTNIWRIDAPVVHNGKVYYGVAKRGYDPATATNITTTAYSTTTLVADYPSLSNLKTISSTISTGENYGYRTPVNYLDERGDIYQMVGNGQSAHILKISNETYDNAYKFSLSTALGTEVGALGWFYVGEGIGYALYYDLAAGQSEEASAWAIARVDVYNKTAIKMNIPHKLWLRQYQKGVLKDGKFYMALAPIGANGAVYMFDPKSTSPNGFTVGATLDNLAGQFFVGIF